MTTNDSIIDVRHISKKYSINKDSTYKTFTESITCAIKHPISAIKNFSMTPDMFWALKDVNFSVERGEALGIIGHNGAGKSTLLKILSRITYPTGGSIEMRGRVGSLLEVGTGFHQELSGRENIYFNGAVLGMRKREIDEKFDEIVKFSDVERFLDTPIKRYSSGMQVRLAFSVAAHLEPEILIVDEVLAVGDAVFQKKCLGKMEEVTESGRTVLFVSHNLGAISSLCDSALLLSHGEVKLRDDTSTVIDAYLSGIDQQSKNLVVFNDNKQKEICILSVQVRPVGSKNTTFEIDDDIEIIVTYTVRADIRNTNIYVGLDYQGTNIIKLFDIDYNPDLFSLRKSGTYTLRIEIPHRFLNIGQWSISVDAGRLGIGIIDNQHHCLNFIVENNMINVTNSSLSRGGAIIPQFSVETSRERI